MRIGLAARQSFTGRRLWAGRIGRPRRQRRQFRFVAGVMLAVFAGWEVFAVACPCHLRMPIRLPRSDWKGGWVRDTRGNGH